MNSKVWISILVSLIVLCSSYFFYLQHRPEPEPVKIYRAIVPGESEIPRASVPAERAGTDALEFPPVSTELDAVSGSESVEMQFAPTDMGSTELAGEETSSPGAAGSEAEITAAGSEEITAAEAAAWLVEQFELLNASFKQNYPDIAMLADLTLEEIHELYPTAEDRAALRERSLSAQAAFFADFRDLFSIFPSDVQDEIWGDLEQELVGRLGAEFTALVMEEIRAGMGQ